MECAMRISNASQAHLCILFFFEKEHEKVVWKELTAEQ